MFNIDNSVTLFGRLTKDPEIRVNNNFTVGKFTLAVNRPKQKDKDQEADFISCVAFGKTAEILGDYVSKGQRLYAHGAISVNRYTDKNGETRYSTSVIVDAFRFIEKAEKGANQNAATKTDSPMENFNYNDKVPF